MMCCRYSFAAHLIHLLNNLTVSRCTIVTRAPKNKGAKKYMAYVYVVVERLMKGTHLGCCLFVCPKIILLYTYCTRTILLDDSFATVRVRVHAVVSKFHILTKLIPTWSLNSLDATCRYINRAIMPHMKRIFDWICLRDTLLLSH